MSDGKLVYIVLDLHPSRGSKNKACIFKRIIEN